MGNNWGDLHRRLCSHGIHEQSARLLLNKHDPNYIEGKIDVLEFVMADSPGRISSTGGFLFKSIEHDYLPPENYKSPEQRAAEQWRKEAFIAKRRKEQQIELAAENARWLRKSQEKLEHSIAAELALQMNAKTEELLHQFINDQRDPLLRTCDGYDLRASTIESKPRDYAAGTFFNLLRVQFFKEICPEAFSDPA
ncbi:MAG: hypothetical protein AAF065_13320 [Verrucomicrobiota bacterium]